MTSPFSRGFRGRPRSAAAAGRLPPGQYETRDFPVLSAGPTPHVSLEAWDFTLRGPGGRTARWTWDEFQALPREPVTADIHCVTKWSKFGTVWEGVSVDTLLVEAAPRLATGHVGERQIRRVVAVAHCDHVGRGLDASRG